MVDRGSVAARTAPAQRWARATVAQPARGAQWGALDFALWCPLERLARAFPTLPNLPPALPGVGGQRGAWRHSLRARRGFACARPGRPLGMLRRRHVHRGEKRGAAVGPTKRGKGTKLMALADAAGLPLAVHTTSASPAEVTLVQATLEARFTAERPARLIGDKAYDSDPLDRQLAAQDIEMIAPHRRGRKRPKTQDGRVLRRYRRRWKIERLFAWLQNFRRILTRHERKAENYLGFVQLGCIKILLRQYL